MSQYALFSLVSFYPGFFSRGKVRQILKNRSSFFRFLTIELKIILNKLLIGTYILPLVSVHIDVNYSLQSSLKFSVSIYPGLTYVTFPSKNAQINFTIVILLQYIYEVSQSVSFSLLSI